MSALSSATSTRAGGRRPDAGVSRRRVRRRRRTRSSRGLGGQPAQRLLHVGSARRRPRRCAGPPTTSASAGRCAAPKGRRMVKVVPAPSTLSAVMRAAVQPDQFLDQRQADAAALVGPGAGVLDAVEPLEQPRHLGGGHADPGVGDGDHRVAVRRRRTPHGDRAVEGELQRVGEQVEDHLLPHVAVDVDRFVQRRAVHRQVQPGPLDRRAEDAGQLGGDGGQVDRLVAAPASGRPRCGRSPAAC